MTDVPLPGMPEPPPRRRITRPDVRITELRRRDRLCFECCRLIHAVGPAVAPYPRSARWRVITPDIDTRVCDLHREDYAG